METPVRAGTAEQLLRGDPQRNEGDVVVVGTPRRSCRLQHADYLQLDAVDRHGLPDRVRAAEELVGRGRTQDRDRVSVRVVGAREEPPALELAGPDLQPRRVGADNARRPVRRRRGQRRRGRRRRR